MRKAFLILAAALIAAAPVAATVTATPTEAAQKEIKKQGGNKGGGKKAQSGKKHAPKARAGNKSRSTSVRHGNSRNNRKYSNNNRHYHNNRYHNNRRYYYRRGYGWGWWAPSAFAAGVVTGAVIATPRVYAAPTVTYYEGAANRVESNAGRVPPAGGYAAFSPGWYEYCSSKYRSFNPNTGTYTGYDGLAHYCQ